MTLPGLNLTKYLIIWSNLEKKKRGCWREKEAEGHKDSEIPFH